MKIRIGIIGGTGFEEAIKGLKEKIIETPYGKIEIFLGKLDGEQIAFVPRHGKRHEKPPHMVNYRGNIWALYSLGVERIIATNAVGGIADKLKPGDLVIVNDFIDFTKSRVITFYNGPDVIHVDMTEPYCPEIRNAILKVINRKKLSVNVWDHGVYACTEGPRFETPAEIRMLRILGADVVGMTGIPEVVLAREAGICYATICIVTNYAAGKQERISVEEVSLIMKKMTPIIVNIISEAIQEIPLERKCNCKIGEVRL
ncbi:MAG: S-methyl-5'-thioadenosine phosphorylase [Candidatus Methanomethylicota archaeon]|uniref:Probable S-methyl-5'-thioinosine phosphorylase n=1 Tax=Thermoproteota archaeon TaxID=2056631 RepID=A0A497EV25_9CREN|nr:MAG: S-methyl-5'-thioadenosine phosphorylase [Candidatus Verstraetearchaeota archaeon]